MVERTFEGFALEALQRTLPSGGKFHSGAKDFVAHRPVFFPSLPVQAVMMFVDGAFQQSSGRGAWAVAVLALQGGRWIWAGFRAGRVPSAAWGANVPSAYQSELYAQLVAHSVGLAGAVPLALWYDAKAAACTAQCQTSVAEPSPLTTMLCTTYTLLETRNLIHGYCHVKNHTGHLGNELADALATAALEGRIGTADAAEEALLQAMIAPEAAWLWLPALAGSGPWPQLQNDGLTCPESLVPSSRVDKPADWSLATDDAASGHALQVKLCIATYNVLSLRSAIQRQCLQAHMKKHDIAVLGVQEARESTEAFKVCDGILRFASEPTAGQLGCQLWLDSNKVLGHDDQGDAMRWDRRDFAVLHSQPRCLFVAGKLGDHGILFVVAHALTNVSCVTQIATWWSELRALVQRHRKDRVLVLMVDANARHDRLAGREEPVGPNADRLAEFIRDLDLSRTPCFKDGKPIWTWVSPQGKGSCLDYILLPKTWMPFCTTLGSQIVLDEYAGIDHRLLLARLELQLHGRKPGKRCRLDIEAMHTPAGKQQIRKILQNVPQIPWAVHIDEHVKRINEHIQQNLLSAFVKQADGPRSPVISKATWDLLHHRRHLRRVNVRRRQLRSRHLLAQAFAGWSRVIGHVRTRNAQQADRNIARIAAADRRLCVAEALFPRELKKSTKAVRASYQKDEAEFTRKTFQEARAEGPHRLAYLLRAVLKSGRRYHPPRASPCLMLDGSLETDAAKVQYAFGKHFAEAEQAYESTLAELQPQGPADPEEVVDVQGAPSLAQLNWAFAALQGRRAAGIAQIPPDFYLAQPHLSALVHYPVVLKILSRKVAPLLWTGHLAVALEKPLKCHTSVEGFRSVAILDIAGKALAKALRHELLCGFERVTLAGTGGTRKGIGLGLPAVTVQGFLQLLHVNRQSGAVLFVDGSSAFFRHGPGLHPELAGA